jgi:hypothetical protein
MIVTKRRWILKFALRTLGMFVVGLIVSAIIAISQIDLESFRSQILAELRQATGLEVEINGKMSWRPSLRPRVALRDVRVPNAKWAKNPDGIKIETIYARVDLFSLLRENITLHRLRIINPVINIERNEKGEYSINPKIESDNSQPDKYPFDVDTGLEAIIVSGLKISYFTPEEIYALDIETLNVSQRKLAESIEFYGDLKESGSKYSFLISFSPLDTKRNVYPIRVAVADSVSPIVAKISLPVDGKKPIEFTTKGDIADPAAVLNRFGIDMEKIAAVNFDITGSFLPEKLKIKSAKINAGKNDLQISGSADFSGDTPKISANVKSDRLVLFEILPDIYKESHVKTERPDRPLNVFKDIPIDGDWIRGYELDIEVESKYFGIYEKFFIGASTSKIVLRSGVLTVNVEAEVADGKTKADVIVRADADGVYANAVGSGVGVNTGKLLKSLDVKDYITGLPANFNFDLETRGKDLTEIMSNVSGPARVYSTDVGAALPAASRYFLGQDFLTALRHTVTDAIITKDKYDTLKIGCAVANIYLENGKVEVKKGVAVETNAVNMRATGNVNLGQEKMNVAMVTVPVRGLKISLTGNVVNAMEIGGSMAEPSVKISGNQLIKKAAKATGIGILLAPFTGGLSILAGAGIGLLAGDLLENWLADTTPCKTAMTSL